MAVQYGKRNVARGVQAVISVRLTSIPILRHFAAAGLPLGQSGIVVNAECLDGAVAT